MGQIKVTEAELQKIISESVQRVLNESEMDEGFWNQMKSGLKGAKQGFQAQKTMDRGTDGFKQQHDHDDARYEMNHPNRKAENTASEQARMIYQQYKQYQASANRLLSQYNAMVKQYGLVKQGVGQVSSPVQAPLGGGVGNPNAPQSIKGARNFRPDMQSKGLWGEGKQ